MYRRFLKRPIDVAAATILLVVISPFGIVTSLLIRVTSGRPVIFRQVRTGLDGNDFTMLKYRTMHAKNDVNDSTTENQLTGIGKVVRALSLDEIPQLLNIVKGEMSFIGPRPWIPEYYEAMNAEQRGRCKVLPGVTGLAQARGRNNLTVHDKINYDLLYIENVTLVNDLKIILLTVRSVFNKTGSAIEKFGIHNEIQTLMAQSPLKPAAIDNAFYSEIPKQNKPTERVSRRSLNSANRKSQPTDMVSIVIPVYNAARFLDDTIKSIQDQTYTNWEAIFVDDCSTDDSIQIIKTYQKIDKRIKLVKNQVNSHTAITRNNGINKAKGRYIALLDADDSWRPSKLSDQIEYMQTNNSPFSFTGYEYGDENCVPSGKIVKVPNTIVYKQSLKNTVIFTSTVIFDLNKLTKEDIQMPLVKYEDTACWRSVLKKIEHAHGLDRALTVYRRSSGSYSSNKLNALKMSWNLYVNVENLGYIKSTYYFCHYVFNATIRRI